MTVSHAPAGGAYAGFWRRVAAFLLDYLIVMVPFLVLGFVLGVMGAYEQPNAALDAFFNILSIVVTWLYWALQESSSKQATLGKRALGLVVTDEAGRRISFGRATGRYFAKILSGIILGIGYLMVAFTARKQGLHDIVANTLVLRGPPPPADLAATFA